MRTGSGTLHARCFTDKCVMLFPSVVVLRNVRGDSSDLCYSFHKLVIFIYKQLPRFTSSPQRNIKWYTSAHFMNFAQVHKSYR